MQTPTRREFGIALTTTAVGGAYALTRGERVSAEATVDADGLSVPDVEAATEGNAVTGVLLTVNASYAYESSHTPDAVALELLSGDQESTMLPIDTHDVAVSGPTGSGEVELSGDITETYHFALIDFEPPDATPVSHTVWTGVRLTVERDGTVLAEETAADSTRVTVDGETLTATAAVGGTGDVAVET